MVTRLKILVACEKSGRLRDALIRRGHDAISCDIEHSDPDGPHIQDDVLRHLADGWDAMIAFPPCTHICCSGARWFAEKRADGRQQQGIDFFMAIVGADIPVIGTENPVGIMSTIYRKPDQIIQPWQFGHPESKATCLWLKGLPLLKPTKIMDCREQKVWRMAPSPERSEIRSRTYEGIAEAMADQWFGCVK